jgi:voltage-gated potassium channel
MATMFSHRRDNKVNGLRQQIFSWLELDQGTKTSTWLNKAIRFLIAFSIIVAVLATEPVIRADHADLLEILDTIIAILFMIEYLLRLWIAPLRPNARPGIRGAAYYAVTPMAILDLLAIAPTILGIVSPELYLLRIFRLVRIARVGRSKNLQKSIRYFNRILSSKKEELQISAIYSGVVICISSVLMYIAEGRIQQEQFGSIPRCIWWAIITVTTVGYGDAIPVSPGGRLVASVTAISGIAVIAIPIGIISAGFSEAWAREQAKDD